MLLRNQYVLKSNVWNNQINIYSITTIKVTNYILSHLQRLIDVGGQDGQEVIYAADQESPWRINVKIVEVHKK